jgi:UDP-N-acetylglucosamine--dolichyl-phosphate N-acetylglucosaminephosphotransferase
LIDLLAPAIISCIVAFFVVFFMTPPLIKILEKRNFAVKDMNKKEDVMVVRPAGPAILAGIITSELILYAFFQMNEILAILITTSAACVIGLLY